MSAISSKKKNTKKLILSQNQFLKKHYGQLCGINIKGLNFELCTNAL